MQKLWDINRWVELLSGSNMVFENTKPRMVRIDFNTPETVLVYIKQGKSVKFLCRTQGRDIVEFAVNGAFELMIESGLTYIHVDEGQLTHFEQTDEETFARIHEPRQRNFEQEFMQYKMKEQFNRRMAEMNKMFDDRMNQEIVNDNANAPVSGDGQAEQEQADLGGSEAEND